MDLPDDCRRCGAGGFSRETCYVAVNGEDWSRLGNHADRLAHFIGHHAHMRRVDNHWAALVARCDESGSGTSFRGVCDQRPLDRILAKPFAAANLLDALRGMPHRGAALNG